MFVSLREKNPTFCFYCYGTSDYSQITCSTCKRHRPKEIDQHYYICLLESLLSFNLSRTGCVYARLSEP